MDGADSKRGNDVIKMLGRKGRAWETRQERGAAVGTRGESHELGSAKEREGVQLALGRPDLGAAPVWPSPRCLPPLGLGRERRPPLPPQVSAGWWPSPGTPSTSPGNSSIPCIPGPSECGSPGLGGSGWDSALTVPVPRYELGPALYLGWSASLLAILGGVCLGSTCCRTPDAAPAPR